MLGGTGHTAFPGDGSTPYIAANAAAVGGDGASLYGDESVALAGGTTYGPRSIAVGTAIAVGEESLALDGGVAGGDGSIASGTGAEAVGSNSLAMGIAVRTGIGIKSATLTNVAADLEMRIPGEILTNEFTAGVGFVIYDFAGGGFDPTVDPTAIVVTSAGAVPDTGDTVVTISGLNLVATSCEVALQSLGNRSLVMGLDSFGERDYSFVMGDKAEAYGRFNIAFGLDVEASDAVQRDELAIAIGEVARALAPNSWATGRRSQSRNEGERAHANGYNATGLGLMLSQLR